MVIVDSTVWIDYLGGTQTPETDWFDARINQQRFGLLDLMLTEILQGLRSDAEAAKVLKHLERFAILETGGKDLAVASAANYRLLRSHGQTVRKTIDCLIAACCIRGGHSLLHRDRDFEPFERFLGLQTPNLDQATS